MDTQWRVLPVFGALPQYIGLDYAAARAGLELAEITITPDLWRDVQQIERGARAALNER